MIEIDGSMGEGGGQIVRTALALSVVTQQALRLTHIRAGRSRPGLRPQHVTAAEAAAAIGNATVSGASKGSSELTFEPNGVDPGTYHFDVGTAGSAILVLQTVLPPLLTANRSSTVTVVGGTHNQSAPPFEFLAHAFLPLLVRMGPVVNARLERPGFYPRGGGVCSLEIQPVERLEPLILRERGKKRQCRARSIVANLPRHIGDRELSTLSEMLPVSLDESRIETPSAPGAGNALILELVFEHVTEVVSAIGEKGRPAEAVAMSVAQAARSYLAASAPVGPHLADQLLLPLSLGGGTFRTTTLTPHTHTNAAVIEHFGEASLTITEGAVGWEIEAQPEGEGRP